MSDDDIKRHLDRRLGMVLQFAEQLGDDLIDTAETAKTLGTSEMWLEVGRTKGYGPPFIVVSPRIIRYHRSLLLAWLRDRVHRCTAEYDTSLTGKSPKRKRKADVTAAVAER